MLKTITLELENIKCDGCVNNIKKAMMAHSHISSTEVDKTTGKVFITGTDLVNSDIINELTQLGYPEKKKGLFSKLNALIQK